MSEFHGQRQPPPQFQPAQKPPKKPMSKEARIGWIVLAGLGVFATGLMVGSAPSSSSATPDAATPAPTVTVTVPNTGPSPDPVTTPTNKPSASVKPTQPKVTKAPAQVACAGQEDRNAPCTVTVGKAFELGKHTVLSGWKLTSEYGTMSITGKAKNTSTETSTMFIDIKFLKGSDVLAVVSCSTNELEPGQTQAMNCFGTDTFTKKYDHVTAEASF